MVSNSLLLLIHRKIFIGDCSRGLCHPVGLLSATAAMVLSIAWSLLLSAIPDGVGVLLKLTMGGHDDSHHMNPWAPEDSVV